MEAMVLYRQGRIEERPLRLSQLPIPTPTSSQILIRVKACGICRTDLHIIEGELTDPKLPLIPGHQVVGVVEEVGEGVSGLRRGDRVGVPWLNFSCGSCAFCKRGNENLCLNARFTGYHVDGGYAQYMVVDEKFAHPVPSELSDIEAAPFLCAGAIGFRALRLSQPKERIGIFGFGSSAHLIIQIANYWGMGVYVFTRSKSHQELARELGAVWVGMADEDPGKKLDSAIIFAPAGELVAKALEKLDRGGRISIAGIYMSQIPPIDYRLLYHERCILSVANCTREDVRMVFELAKKIPFKVFTQVFPLKEANEALILLKGGKIKGSGVLLVE